MIKFAGKKMPKIKTNRVKYPEGWELIEPTLRELQAKMREGIISIVFYYPIISFLFTRVYDFDVDLLFCWLQLRMTHMMVRESARLYGLYSK